MLANSADVAGKTFDYVIVGEHRDLASTPNRANMLVMQVEEYVSERP